MSVPTRSCPACGADLSVGIAAMPGVCPACGRDVRLEEIVANLPRPEDKPISPQKPLGVMECALVAFSVSLSLGLVGGLMMKQNSEGPFLGALFLGTPHFFMGFFTAGFFSRTMKAQLFYGSLMSLVFAGASFGFIYFGCRRL